MKFARLFLLPVLFVALAAPSCQTTPPNPVATAQRPETQIYAMTSLAVSAEEIAADIAEAPSTPQAVKDALKAADVKASPFIESGKPTAKLVEQVRADLAAGGASKQEQLMTAITKANDWINQASPIFRDLGDALADAKAQTKAPPKTPAANTGATTP